MFLVVLKMGCGVQGSRVGSPELELTVGNLVGGTSVTGGTTIRPWRGSSEMVERNTPSPH